MSMYEDLFITPEMLLAGTSFPTQPYAAKDAVVWLERDPNRDGKYNIIFSLTKNLNFDEETFSGIGLLPDGYAVGSRIHEYGGRAIYLDLVSSEGGCSKYLVVFSCAADQRLYAIDIFCISKSAILATTEYDFYTLPYQKMLALWDIYWTHPLPLTPSPDSSGEYRFACPVGNQDKQYLFAICEKHLFGEKENVINSVVAIPLDGSASTQEDKILTLEEEHDFYAFLTVAKTGHDLSYIAWDHPDMPWDHTCLITNKIEISDGEINKTSICRVDREDFSITQPSYGSGDTLFCISDISGWTNLYFVANDGTSYNLQSICEGEYDFAKPDWVIGKYSYAECGDRQIVAVYTKDNVDYLLFSDLDKGESYPLDLPYTQLDWLSSDGDLLYFIGASPDDLPVLCVLRISDRAMKRTFSDCVIKKELIVRGEHYDFIGADGGKVYALIYQPLGRNNGEMPPPLLINIHGGPTGSVSNTLDISKQFWTSRGFLVADLDFRGSTGHGRNYRRQIQWGKTDVEDAIGLALALSKDGLVDKDKLFIRGKSSGGFTVLSAMQAADVFAGGVSYYGVCDPLSLSDSTHKFESHYFESLIGKLPESEALYRERSVLNKAFLIKNPVLLFHGLDDKVVPIEQTMSLAVCLYKQGTNCELFTFPDEGHGFRESETIQFCHLAEWRFYQAILGKI